MVEPFEPHSAIVSGALCFGSSRKHTLPAVSRTVLKMPSTSASSVCSASHPG